MARKRTGEGGNSSKDPRNNLRAQKEFRDRQGKTTKRCTGFLHHDGPEIPVVNFRQQKSNGSTGLQSRCDLCNRLYFSIIQKPTKRIAATVIWADMTGILDWRSSCPPSLVGGIEECLRYWRTNGCPVKGCKYSHHHASFRLAAKTLTDAWRDRDKEPRTATVIDRRSGEAFAAPKFMSDLQSWAGTEGKLWTLVDVAKVWDWWCTMFPEDTATCSSERNAVRKGKVAFPLPEHPLTDFSWGSGNILETTQGHSVPGFNQVRASVRVLPRSSGVSGRAYGYLCEGDHLAMRKFSERCKAEGKSLGHSPAPLRWLGKNDPINGQPQDLKKNIGLSDSLAELHSVAIKDPVAAGTHVSWQVRSLVIALGNERVSCEEFTQRVQAHVEEYLNVLEEDVRKGDFSSIRRDLERADSGQPESVYSYRQKKVIKWLMSRPQAMRST